MILEVNILSCQPLFYLIVDGITLRFHWPPMQSAISPPIKGSISEVEVASYGTSHDGRAGDEAGYLQFDKSGFAWGSHFMLIM